MTAEPIELVRAASANEFRPKGEKDPVLFTGYLFMNPEARLNRDDPYARWVLDLQVRPKYERVKEGLLFTSRSPFEGDAFINDRVEFGFSETKVDKPFVYRWHSEGGDDQQPSKTTVAGTTQQYTVPLTAPAPRFFKKVQLLIDVDAWS